VGVFGEDDFAGEEEARVERSKLVAEEGCGFGGSGNGVGAEDDLVGEEDAGVESGDVVGAEESVGAGTNSQKSARF